MLREAFSLLSAGAAIVAILMLCLSIVHLLIRNAGAQRYFTGGMMPSDDLLTQLGVRLRLRQHWQVPGTHYQKTSEARLRNMDCAKSEMLPLFAGT